MDGGPAAFEKRNSINDNGRRFLVRDDGVVMREGKRVGGEGHAVHSLFDQVRSFLFRPRGFYPFRLTGGLPRPFGLPVSAHSSRVVLVGGGCLVKLATKLSCIVSCGVAAGPK